MKKRNTKTSGLSADDRHLWRRVTKTVSPLKNRTGSDSENVADEDNAWRHWVQEHGMVDRTPAEKPLAENTQQGAEAVLNPALQKPDPVAPASITKKGTTWTRRAIHEIERPTHRKLAKGRLPIDARLDLHHQTQEQAHRSLNAFLVSSHRKGHRHVLVITGKGRSLNSQGVLRKMLPIWISTPPMNMFVSAIRHASRDHGGEGAWYIRLKRPKSDDRT
ncbi:MAG: Smr/MutS family protein [Pseudomonadota bacterium]